MFLYGFKDKKIFFVISNILFILRKIFLKLLILFFLANNVILIRKYYLFLYINFLSIFSFAYWQFNIIIKPIISNLTKNIVIFFF